MLEEGLVLQMVMLQAGAANRMRTTRMMECITNEWRSVMATRGGSPIASALTSLFRSVFQVSQVAGREFIEPMTQFLLVIGGNGRYCK